MADSSEVVYLDWQVRQRPGDETKIGGTLSDIAKKGDEATKSARGLEAQAKASASGVGGLGKSIAGLAATLGILAGLKKGFDLIRESIQSFGRQEAAIAQVEARIVSTGGAAGRTSGQLQAMASELQRSTTFGDEAILEMQSLLLTFTKVTGENFDTATGLVLDMSVAMGTDLKSSALQVGKALNDPIRGVTALSRAGVQFSESQRETIRSLVETGRTADAQRVILAELETQFGGAAAAARDTLPGAMTAAGNAVDDLKELVGEGLAPSLGDVAGRLENLATNPAAAEFARQVGSAFGTVISWVVAGVENFWTFRAAVYTTLAEVISTVRGWGLSVIDTFDNVYATLQRGASFLGPFGAGLRSSIGDMRSALAEGRTAVEGFGAETEEALRIAADAAIDTAAAVMSLEGPAKKLKQAAPGVIDLSGALDDLGEAGDGAGDGLKKAAAGADQVAESAKRVVAASSAWRELGKDTEGVRRSLVGVVDEMIDTLESEIDAENRLEAARRQGGQALADAIVAERLAALERAAAEKGVKSLTDAERARAEAAIRSSLEVRETAAGPDRLSDAYKGAMDEIAGNFVGMLGDMVRGGKHTWGDLFGSMADSAFGAFEQILKEWIATKLKMEAANVSVSASGGGGGGINAGGLSSMAGGASAATLGIVAVFAAAAYAWHNDRQHDYRLLETAVRDIEAVFGELSDTLGEHLPVLASAVEVRKDGDRFRSRVGFDDGSAGYAYFDEYADAIGAAVLSSLREQLGQADQWFAGPLAHLGEEALKVIGKITDSVIAQGQAGVQWLQRGLDLARQLDQGGMSEMARTVADIERRYRDNIRTANEYGLSLRKVGDLFRQELMDLAASTRDRIAQYLPGYDPVGDEFDDIRADNATIREAFERVRKQLEDEIAGILRTIERLAAGNPEGSAGGGLGAFAQVIDDYMRGLMELQFGGGLGAHSEAIAGVIDGLGDMMNTLVSTGGIAPDAAARIAEQRARLAELMGELEGLNDQGLSDEEIDAAERAARRRQNRGGGGPSIAEQRESLVARLVEVERAAMDAFDRQLLEHQEKWDREIAEATRLGESIERVTAARRLEAEAMAEGIRERVSNLRGGGESLRDRRNDIIAEAEELRRQNELLLEQEGLLATERWRINQAERAALRALAEEVIGSLGLPMEQTREGFARLRESLGLLWASAYDGTISFERMREVLDQLEQQAAGQLFGLAAGILETMGATEQAAQFRARMEEATFDLKVAQLNYEFEQYQLLGLLSEEAIERLEDALDYINDPANRPTFAPPPPPPPPPPPSAGTSGGDPGANLDRLRQQVMDQIEAWERLELSPNERRLAELQDRIAEVHEMALEAGFSAAEMARLQAAGQAAIQDFWRGVTQPIRDFYDSMGLSQFSPAGGRERLGQAQSEFESLVARLQANPRDLEALEQLTGAAQAFLGEAQAFTGGQGPLYSRIFAQVQQVLAAVLGEGGSLTLGGRADLANVIGGAGRFSLDRQGADAAAGAPRGGVGGQVAAGSVDPFGSSPAPVVRAIEHSTDRTVAAIEEGNRRLERLERHVAQGNQQREEVARNTGTTARNTRERASASAGADKEIAAATYAAMRRVAVR